MSTQAPIPDMRAPSDSAEPTTPSSRRERSGFALLAIIVAIVVLATAVMAISAANTTRLRTQTISDGRTIALAIARSYLESVRARDPWDLADESPVRVNAAGVADAGGAYTRALEITEERANLLRVEVIVTAPRLATPVQIVTNAFRPARRP